MNLWQSARQRVKGSEVFARIDGKVVGALVFVGKVEDEVEVEVETEVVETREANTNNSGAACATALQYAGGEARTALRRPKPPSLMGNVRVKRASEERGAGRRSFVTAVEMKLSSKYSAEG